MKNVFTEDKSLLLRGSVVQVRRKCGKKVCKCLEGELHETWALSYSRQGRTQMIPIREEDITPVKKAIHAYNKELDKLNAQALTGIQKLHRFIRIQKEKAQ